MGDEMKTPRAALMGGGPGAVGTPRDTAGAGLTDHHHVVPAVVAADGEVEPAGGLGADHQRDVPVDVLQHPDGPGRQEPQHQEQDQPQHLQHPPARHVGRPLGRAGQEHLQHPARRGGVSPQPVPAAGVPSTQPPRTRLPVQLEGDGAVDDGEAQHAHPAQDDAAEDARLEVQDEHLGRGERGVGGRHGAGSHLPGGQQMPETRKPPAFGPVPLLPIPLGSPAPAAALGEGRGDLGGD